MKSLISYMVLFSTFFPLFAQKPDFKKFRAEADKIASSIEEPSIPNLEINLISYSGQKPDENGSYDFRDILQKAIEELSSKGGGRIVLAHTESQQTWIKQSLTYRCS